MNKILIGMSVVAFWCPKTRIITNFTFLYLIRSFYEWFLLCFSHTSSFFWLNFSYDFNVMSKRLNIDTINLFAEHIENVWINNPFQIRSHCFKLLVNRVPLFLGGLQNIFFFIIIDAKISRFKSLSFFR